MEVEILNNENHTRKQSKTSPFIEGNTIALSLEEIQTDHVIPVFIKDNEPAISHGDFVYTVQEAARKCFSMNSLIPSVRVSHPIKGRIPSAKLKPADELLDHERTLYYERMAFIVEFPEIEHVVDGNVVSLTVGGIKAYSLDNFYNKKGADEHFKVFAGFKNHVCTNLCTWSDGFSDNLTARSLKELQEKVLKLFYAYNAESHVSQLHEFSLHTITERQFAQLLGRCRLYNFLPSERKKQIPTLKLTDTQLGKVAELACRDPNFGLQNGEINLWRLYNLLTSANKSSYINDFLDRNASAHELTKQIIHAVKHKETCWFLM